MSAPWTYGGGKCEVCGHYASEGLNEGACQECRDAYPEDYAELDGDAVDCDLCQGTGIGQRGDPDTSVCWKCRGRGYSTRAETKARGEA